MYGYIYETTNLVNGKKYIGQHKSKEFDKTYYGSGNLINKAISKYGKNNFKVDVLKWCETKEQLNDSEKYYIKQLKESKCECYNISDGGTGGNNRFGKMSDEHRNKISKSLTGKKFSEDRKVNIGNGRRGVKSTITPKWEEYLNSIRGKPSNMSEKQRQAIRKAVCHPMSDATKQKLREINLGKPSCLRGKVCVYKENVNKMICIDELNEYISSGWVRGMKRGVR